MRLYVRVVIASALLLALFLMVSLSISDQNFEVGLRRFPRDIQAHTETNGDDPDPDEDRKQKKLRVVQVLVFFIPTFKKNTFSLYGFVSVFF